ncbi:MAG: M23 family metallopeptidase [Anaerolineales bacterium]
MENPDLKANLAVEFLSADKKVIPIFCKNGDVWHTDIKLPDIVIANQGGLPITVTDIFLAGYIGETEVVRFHQEEGVISQIILESNRLLNRLIGSASDWAAYNRGMLYGKIKSEWTEFSESNQIEPSAAVCLRLYELIPFHYLGMEKIEDVVCILAGKLGDNRFKLEYPIQITPYECKGDYVFPIRGRSTVVGTPWNRYAGHRLATSQEFAFDVVDFRVSEEGGFAVSDPPESSSVNEYFFFEREVHAVGDGQIVACGNSWPNEWVKNPQINPDDRIIEQTQQLLDAGMDFVHAILGNYAIIDHLNGEYSVYAHMSENSVAVQVGDQVKQGQVIGKVGNTSNSDFPHLHFHLMDSPDFITANGLPVKFKNIPDSTPPVSDLSQTNSFLYSDYLFLNIPE